jgi:catechol 2,3-dioxygenase
MDKTNNWELGKVVLKVNDLEKMTAFYQEAIGLDILEKQAHATVLGVKTDNVPLVELIEIPKASSRTVTAGLYHLAILLPTRGDLGAMLYHLVTKKYDLVGASDHGYSEALYLNDPEGNGIEIYRDKPMAEWDIRPDGRIEGITAAMDTEAVVQSMEKLFAGIPSGTKMGHVHLTVHDLEDTEEFYVNVLGIALKSNYFGQAKFFASGNYHHHIGSNVWSGRNLPAPLETQTGMAYYTWLLPSKSELDALKDRLEKNNVAYETAADTLIFKDNSGITIHATVGK